MSNIRNGALEANQKPQGAWLGRNIINRVLKGSKVLRFNGITVVIMAAQPKRAIRNYVAERVAAGLCLVGPKTSETATEQCERCAEKRGVCSMHYQQFNNLYLRTPDDRKAKLESDSIHAGAILPSRQGKAKDHVNAYAVA